MLTGGQAIFFPAENWKFDDNHIYRTENVRQKWEKKYCGLRTGREVMSTNYYFQSRLERDSFAKFLQ